MPLKYSLCTSALSLISVQKNPIDHVTDLMSLTRLMSITVYCMMMYFSLSLDQTHTVEAKSQVTSQAPCGEDLYEPNNLRSRARNLSFELKNTREITAHLCRQDQDWYTVWLNQGELVEFHVIASLDVPPQIKVFAPRKRKPKGIARRLSPDHRQLRIYANRSGRYRILISGGRDARTQYQLYLRRPSPPGHIKR